MKYIGSGPLNSLNSDSHMDWVVWGRRMHNISFVDLSNIKKMNCIYLDTVNINKSTKKKLNFFLRIYSVVHPYRIEKKITFYLLSLFAKKVVRVHVPLITDSRTWKDVYVKEGGIILRGLSYNQLSSVIKVLVSQVDAGYIIKRLSHTQLIDFAMKNHIESTSISVRADSYGVRFLVECVN